MSVFSTVSSRATHCSFTEMVVADAAIHGPRDRLLGFDDVEQPVALQIGGARIRAKLAEAARIGAGFGYREINLNVGCPSDRVQSGTFGACLMKTPDPRRPLRGGDKSDGRHPRHGEVPDRRGRAGSRTGPSTRFCLGGLGRRCRRLVGTCAEGLAAGAQPQGKPRHPPVDYDRVYRLKQANESRFIGLNGGVQSLAEVPRPPRSRRRG